MSVISEAEVRRQIPRWAAQAILLIPLCGYLSDILSPVFAAFVFGAAAAGGYLAGRSRMRIVFILPAGAAAALLVRAGVIAAITLAPGGAAVDFSAFSFDSGFFPLLPVFMYIFAAGMTACRKPGFLFAEPLINAVFFGLLLWSQHDYNITVFAHPGILVVYSIVFVLLEISALLTAANRNKGDIRAVLLFLAVAVPLFLIALFFLFGRYTEGASRDSGGLMQPTLFRFDFSDYVKLESEISMDNDIVMLLRNYGYLNSVYLRRFYLSGYEPGRGFFLQQGPGEEKQQLSLPQRPVRLETEHYPGRIESEQEYFIVNFDPTSLIAMNYPVEISPLTNWSDSSFIQNYRVLSETVELPSWELADAPLLNMESDLLEFYTAGGDDPGIKALAEEITAGLVTPYDRVIAIMFYLHDNYFYSLKPGVASDGNQLNHFLFRGKKGYCSYFAFSMALMCRSIGIPARVSAGFFIDPQSGILNVYPVREDMAHAWVEVPFEGFGWIEFDPTTDRLAPGEDLEFGALDSSEYSALVEEIFANEYDIDAVRLSEEDADGNGEGLASVIKRIGMVLRFSPALSVLLIYLAALAGFHMFEVVSVRCRSVSGRVRRQYRRAVRLARCFGCRRGADESILEHAARADRELFGLSSDRHNPDRDLSRAGVMTNLAGVYLESVFAGHELQELRLKSDAASKAFRERYRSLPAFRRAVVFMFPFIRVSCRRSLSGVSAAVLLAAFLFCFPVPPVRAQDAGGAEGVAGGVEFYLESAEREEDSENYEAALKLLNEGMERYPDSWELAKAAGDLYSDRELYNLAREQYSLALELNPGSTEVLYSKSVAEGFLNLDRDSIHSLEQILETEPDHYDALADLGWMYFKTYRLTDAERLLLEAVKLYEDSPILYMTLGTVYSGMYDYSNAEQYYLKSIDLALNKGWEYFASVSYYNLSLLEQGFYHYEKALEYTNKSIENGERAPGYIARAEINLGRLDFKAAYQNYQQAYIMDSTPLALMGLADLYTTFGLLDEALSHIKEVIRRDDESWMYYFGVDPQRHMMETDRLLMEIYYGLSNRERFSPAVGAGRFRAWFKRAGYYALGWFHERRYRSTAYNVGSSNEVQGNRLDAAWSYFIANEDYRRIAAKYLSTAEEIETAAAPGAEGSYLLEQGRLHRDTELLLEALEKLDGEWERRWVAEAAAELVKLNSRNNSEAAAVLSEQLYQYNPGMFVREGLRFPLQVDFKAGFFLRRALRRSGFNIFLNNQDNRYRYRLTAADNHQEGGVYSVTDTLSGEITATITVQNRLNSPSKASAFTAELKKRLFRIDNGKDVPF